MRFERKNTRSSGLGAMWWYAPLVLATLAIVAGCGRDEPVTRGDTTTTSVTTTTTATAPTTPSEATDTTSTYTVRRGENLTEIAERFGVTVDAIVRANDIADPDLIHPGDVLTIPAQ